jgi:hypothetical protein
MKRREFISTSIAAAGLGLLGREAKAEETAPARVFYELRQYHLRRGPKQEKFDHFYRDAAIPAYNRAGIEKVGVFTVAVGPDSPTMYVLLTHKTLDSVAAVPAAMAADAEYQTAGADFMNAPATDPSFERAESMLMMAFSGAPKLEVPSFGDAAKGRVFELRTYESHSKKANNKKIEMFNNGEIAIFRHSGFQPVFFGETLIGPRLPNLTYMLSSESQPAHEKAWSTFGSDPDWKKLRSTPGYTDSEIVSKISNVFLRPTGYSQI